MNEILKLEDYIIALHATKWHDESSRLKARCGPYVP
jgi:hypothetical protein